MARLTDRDRELILADWHTGRYSHSELGKRYNTSHVTIGKICRGIEPKHADKVTAQIAINTALAQESYEEVTAVTKAVDEATRQLLFFNNSLLKNQALANKKLNDNLSINELEVHSRLTARNKEGVLGKQADTVINNSNNSIIVEIV
jgi:hypothetical protein